MGLFRRKTTAPAFDLRTHILHTDPVTLGFRPGPDRSVWGAAMDMALAGGAATLISLQDGSTSLYTSTGGGVVGGGAHESVVEATDAFLDAMQIYAPGFDAAESDAVPPEGYVRFHALTFDGRRSADAEEAALQAQTHDLWPLYFSAHQVITALRLATEHSDQA